MFGISYKGKRGMGEDSSKEEEIRDEALSACQDKMDGTGSVHTGPRAIVKYRAKRTRASSLHPET